MLEAEVERRRSGLLAKRRQVRDLIMQQLSFRRLVQRNKLQEEQNRALGLHMHEGEQPHAGAAGAGAGAGAPDADGSAAMSADGGMGADGVPVPRPSER